MRPLTRFVLLTLTALSLCVLALPALGVESEEGGAEEEEAPTTTEVVEFEYEPAVVVPTTVAEEAEQPWTTKFLVPTGLALAAIAVFATVVQYFVRVVRTRYKVVE